MSGAGYDNPQGAQQMSSGKAEKRDLPEEIPAYVDTLVRDLDRVEDVLGNLEEKLSPVIKPVDGSQVGCALAEAETELGSSISSCSQRARGLIDRLETLTGQIAL